MLFNLAEYERIVRSIKGAGHHFIDFSEIDASDRKSILLRHDIDADLGAALIMARLEADAGIRATYFFMLRSPLYNLMGRENFGMACQIRDLGHAIGLHYDQGFDVFRGWTHEQTQGAIENEARWLESQFDARIAAVSFHQPGSAVLQNEIDTKARISTYDKERLTRFRYYSDSNRCFPLADVFEKGAREICEHLPEHLQLLIHPMWWVYDDGSTREVWNRAIQANFAVTQRQLLNTERAYSSARRLLIE